MVLVDESLEVAQRWNLINQDEAVITFLVIERLLLLTSSWRFLLEMKALVDFVVPAKNGVAVSGSGTWYLTSDC